MERSALTEMPMSMQDFALLGLHQLAYVKPVHSDGSVQFTIYAADGTEIANVENEREVAFAAVRQHDLEPLSVH